MILQNKRIAVVYEVVPHILWWDIWVETYEGMSVKGEKVYYADYHEVRRGSPCFAYEKTPYFLLRKNLIDYINRIWWRPKEILTPEEFKNYEHKQL